jgi:hypothetical protein
MGKKILLLALVAFHPGFAEAARYCADPVEISNRARNCGDNEDFSGAAVECLEKFEKAIETQKAAMAVNMAAKGAASAKSQAGKQNNAMLDYMLSKEALNLLIDQAKKAQTETAAYYDQVVWPEDWDEPKITGPDFDAFLNSDPCYKDNRDMIANVLGDFDNYIAQLEEARDLSSNMQKATSGKETSMDSLSAGVTAEGKKATGPKAPDTKVSGKSPKKASNITGVEEDAKKRNK